MVKLSYIQVIKRVSPLVEEVSSTLLHCGTTALLLIGSSLCAGPGVFFPSGASLLFIRKALVNTPDLPSG